MKPALVVGISIAAVLVLFLSSYLKERKIQTAKNRKKEGFFDLPTVGLGLGAGLGIALLLLALAGLYFFQSKKAKAPTGVRYFNLE